MPDPIRPRRNKSLAALLGLLWMSPNLLTLFWLHLEFRIPPLGILLHACLLLFALFPMVLLPWAASKLIRCEFWAHLCTAILLSSTQWLLLAFYALSVVGLRTWGFWMTWPIARAYLKHIPSTMEALGYSWRAGALGVGLLWLLLLICYLKLSPSLYCLVNQAFFGIYGFRHRMALVASIFPAVILAQSFVRDRPFWNANEPLEIARSAHRPFISQFPSIGDSARQAREAEAVSRYLAASPGLKTARPLVLITVDAMRADQMGVYGGPRDNTPFLSALVKQGRMQRLGPIYSNSTWSYPALIGVLSSKYPGQFTSQPWNLADVLRRLGYVNYCFFSGDHIHFGDLRWMLGSSIDVYRDGASEDARYPNDDLLLGEWLGKENWPSDRPVFLFLHLMSVHELGALKPEYMRWEKAPDRATANHQALRDRYQDRILQADARLQQLFALLDSKPAFKNALIIVTADHGEFLGEFGHTSHGQEPYEAVIRIPLLIVDPLHADYPKRSLGSLIDIAPTFLEAIGAPTPSNWQGIAWQKDVERNAIVVESTSVFSVVGVFEGRRYKYFHWRKSGAESLFDLNATEGKEEIDLLKQPVSMTAKSDLEALRALRTLAHGMLSK